MRNVFWMLCSLCLVFWVAKALVFAALMAVLLVLAAVCYSLRPFISPHLRSPLIDPLKRKD